MGKSYQVNQSSPNKLQYEITEGVLTIAFPVVTPATTYAKGQPLKLTNTGEVDTPAAGQLAFGYVFVQNEPTSLIPEKSDFVTVATLGQDVNFGYAKGGALAIGALVSTDGLHVGDLDFVDYIVATTGTYATGMVLVGGASGAKCQVMLFKSPVLIP